MRTTGCSPNRTQKADRLDIHHDRLPGKLQLEKGNHIGACFLYTRRLYEAVGDYDPELFLVEDYDYFMRASRHFRFCHIAEPLYYFRRDDDTLYLSRFRRGEGIRCSGALQEWRRRRQRRNRHSCRTVVATPRRAQGCRTAPCARDPRATVIPARRMAHAARHCATASRRLPMTFSRCSSGSVQVLQISATPALPCWIASSSMACSPTFPQNLESMIRTIQTALKGPAQARAQHRQLTETTPAFQAGSPRWKQAVRPPKTIRSRRFFSCRQDGARAQRCCNAW